MKERFRIVQLGNRGGAFYCKDILTGSRTSLATKNRGEAERNFKELSGYKSGVG